MAKNSQKELEQQNSDEKETNENKEADDFNDWNNDDQEWFTINSLATKVKPTSINFNKCFTIFKYKTNTTTK